MVVAKETVGNLGGMVRQLSLDQFENESRRMVPMNNELSYPTKKFTRQKSPQGLHKKVSIKYLQYMCFQICWGALIALSMFGRLYRHCYGHGIGEPLSIEGFS